ncbi:prephenate dehydrogenase [Cytobacillus suaedae]|nr:prephenate dehydrogenase [Cytobacillus suaedae]
MEGNVLVIGLGLIGGSIALAMKDEYNCKLIGYDLNQDRLRLAKSLNVIDDSVFSIEEGAEIADLIIIAVPVTETIAVLRQLAKIQMKSGALITDVGSTKKVIVDEACSVLPDYVDFVGGHPMAGSHKSGVEAAKKDLFENAFYVLTPTSKTSESAISTLEKWLACTRSTIVKMSAEEHDHVAGVVSHFPHIIASSLVEHAEIYHQETPIIQDLAAGGFKDITRIASSNPKMWSDILLHNREGILQQFEVWMKQMNRIQESIRNSSRDEIFHFFEHAKEFRDEFSTRKGRALATYFDLFIDIPDSPGVLAEITNILAKNEINITNIEIIESREDIYGVLRVSFRNESDRVRANKLISPIYETYILQ